MFTNTTEELCPSSVCQSTVSTTSCCFITGHSGVPSLIIEYDSCDEPGVRGEVWCGLWLRFWSRGVVFCLVWCLDDGGNCPPIEVNRVVSFHFYLRTLVHFRLEFLYSKTVNQNNLDRVLESVPVCNKLLYSLVG